MKILHFVLGKADKKKANGVNQVVAGLAKYCNSLEAEVRVIGKSNSAGIEGELLQQDGFEVQNFTMFSQELRKNLINGIKWADVVHLHGVYSPLNIKVGKICIDHKTPYVVTPHSGLASTRKALKGKLKKTLFHEFIQKKHLTKASMLHALTEEEATEIVRSIGEHKISVIPNGIDLEDFPESKPTKPLNKSGVIRLGYIGRIAREKNLFALCEAVAELRGHYNLELHIAGPESEDSRQMASKWPDDLIKLVGPKYAESKKSFLREMDLIVLPSLSEGMSITALEALAVGTPLLATRDSNMTYYLPSEPFIMCESTVSGLVRGLRRALEEKDLEKISLNGRRTIDTQLNWKVISAEMIGHYKSLKNS